MFAKFIYLCLTLAVALSVGFGSAYFMLEDGRQLSAQKYGSWYGWPNSGAADIDPYLKASLARSGNLQMGRAEGVVFTADTDDDDISLSANCSYQIAGTTPNASVWTLRIQHAQIGGQVIDPHYLVSSEIVYNSDGTFNINVSQNVQPGNWLPILSDKEFAFIMTFYDTNAFLVVGNEVARLPSVRKVSCL
ncbi:DUF1214 domain-containing protein [Maritalea sp.]|uniref:DUF1214 domain-containing protein n=1 Tax=Maritalea sp. TaxID=2003361 RepID=UPI003EF6BA31